MYECVVITDYKEPFVYPVQNTFSAFDVDYREFENPTNTYQRFHPVKISVPDMPNSDDIDHSKSQPTSDSSPEKTYLYASNYKIERADVIKIIKDISLKPIS